MSAGLHIRCMTVFRSGNFNCVTAYLPNATRMHVVLSGEKLERARTMERERAARVAAKKVSQVTVHLH